jgi:nicotinamidase-related amidase
MPDGRRLRSRPTGPSSFPNWSSIPTISSSASSDGELRRHGVTQVFLTGVATSAGVESTARSAFDHGYNVVLVVDAITDRDADAHRHGVERIFPRLGETDTTDNVLTLLNGHA